MKRLIIAALIFMSISVFVVKAYAHSGGTDRYGCHYDRKTGFYHCH